MNILADTLAKEANSQEFNYANIANLSLCDEYGPVLINSHSPPTKITSSFTTSLYSALSEKPLRKYWTNKYKITSPADKTIAWNPIAKAFSSLPKVRQVETVKWNSEFCATGKNLRRWKEQQHSACPTCGSENETTAHILQCPHPSATNQWSNALSKLEEWLHQQSTLPDITKLILENLRAWRDHRPSVQYNGPFPYLRLAQMEQSSLGWEPFLRGFPTITWAEAQNCHYKHIQSKRSGERWLSELIKKLWAVSWDMWRFRNGILHSQSDAPPTNFTFLLTASILAEINHGCRLLPPSCHYLFASPASSIFRGSVNSKKLWLATVWCARDLYSPADVICQSRNALVRSFVDSWKKRTNN